MRHFIVKHVILSLLMIWLIEVYIDLDLPELGFVFVPALAMCGVEIGYHKLFPKAERFPG